MDVKTEKKLASQEATLMPLDRPWLLLSENLDHHPPKNEPCCQEMHLKIPLSSRVWNCQILNQVVESQLLISSRNRNHHWLSDIKLIQMSAFSASYSRINLCFTVGKLVWVRNCHTARDHRKTTVFTSIVYAMWAHGRSAYSKKKIAWMLGWSAIKGKKKKNVCAMAFSTRRNWDVVFSGQGGGGSCRLQPRGPSGDPNIRVMYVIVSSHRGRGRRGNRENVAAVLQNKESWAKVKWKAVTEPMNESLLRKKPTNLITTEEWKYKYHWLNFALDNRINENIWHYWKRKNWKKKKKRENSLSRTYNMVKSEHLGIEFPSKHHNFSSTM
jgi:hypothetical protein